MNVADLMNVPVTEVTDRMTWFEKCFPNIYLSTPSECLKVLVDSMCVRNSSYLYFNLMCKTYTFKLLLLYLVFMRKVCT